MLLHHLPPPLLLSLYLLESLQLISAADAAIVTLTFALTPAQLHLNAIMDLSQKEGQLLYSIITTLLQNNYDGSTRGILYLLNQLRRRAETAGWDKTTVTIFKFDVILDRKVRHLDLLINFGMIKLDQMIAYARTYYATSTRQAQNAYCIYKALINLLTAPEYEHLIGYLDQVKVKGIKNGPILFKLIICKSTIETRSIVTVIRIFFRSLDQYMATMEGNLQKFTKHIKIDRLALKCRKEKRMIC